MRETALIRLAAQQVLASGMSLSEGVRELRKAMIAESLETYHGNVCQTARALHMHRNTLSRQMDELRMRDVAAECRAERRMQRPLSYSRRQPGPSRISQERVTKQSQVA
jgi:Bacterial regulatory protein, Fis family